jgi:DNA-binding NarL/FixJ family response regulator
VEDNRIVRLALSAAIDQFDDLAVVGIATSRAEVLIRLDETPADVIMVGSVPERDALEIVAEVQEHHPAMAHLVIAEFSESVVEGAMTEGLRGIVPKDAPVEALRDAIRAVVAERPRLGYLAPRRAVIASKQDSFGRLLATLTPQEARVLELLVRGHSDSEIAGILHLAADTVRHHVSRILKKLRKRSRTQVAIEMLRYKRND